jgi:alpha-tubulin suppressor-like RCC1 family protein
VADGFGNAIPGINVTFTAGGPPGSVVEHATTVTDSNGHATAGAWTLGSATGDYTLTAAAANLPTTRVVFRARINAPFAVSSLAAGGMSSCAIAGSGTYCWGASFQGSSHALTPTRLSSAPPLVTLVVGLGHACGLTSSGTAYCWGANAYGQLGLGTVTYVEPQPRAVTGGLAFTALVVGGEFTCGLATDRRIYCWGDNSVGQLGSEGAARSSPTAVGTSEAIAAMAAGYQHACATATSGTTYCWGADNSGQLGGPAGEICQITVAGYYGDGPYVINVPCSRTPIPLPKAPGAFTALTASYGTCGLLGTGESYCWGFSRSTIPAEGRFVSLAASYQGVCGITTTQSISCWSYADSTAPSKLTVVPGIADPIGLVGGSTHWCAIAAASKTAFCWGGNINGQLGNGTLVSTTRPLPVAAP